jgi:hypothetical protein
MRPAHGTARRALLAACTTLLGSLVAAGGCASPAIPAAIPLPPTARIELVNRCDGAWRVRFAAPAGQPVRVIDVPARTTVRVDLAGGDYAITQTALSGLADAAATRRLSAHLGAGEAYRWQLVTLFSAASDGAQP